MTEKDVGKDQINHVSESRSAPNQSRYLTPLSLGFLGITVVALTVSLMRPPEAIPTPTATPHHTPYSVDDLNLQPQVEDGHRVEREAVAFTTLVPTSTPYLTPTIAPVTPIPWTEEDVNALTWLCYEEVRGMREARYDACLSVISTVRRRYAYDDDPYREDTIEETLLRENQFPIEFDLTRPAPDDFLVQAVSQYQWGARGSCNGYLYYDSVPDGPSLCVIRSVDGQFVEFHDGWR
jgi:hypothetical protein